MKVIEPKLYSRNGHLYYRTTVPAFIQDVVKRREIVISLSTKDIILARALISRLELSLAELVNRNRLPSLDGKVDDQALKSAIQAISRITKNKKNSEIQFSPTARKYLNGCGSQSAKTVAHKERSLALFAELVGNLRLSDIDSEKARYFKARLLQIPKNAKKHLKIDELNKVTSIGKFQPQHPNTINSRLIVLSTFMSWCIDQNLYSAKNPFSGLAMSAPESSGKSRLPFNSVEIKRILELVDWSNDQVLFWLPAIAVYNGLRLNEICQLTPEDISFQTGVWCFDINVRDGKRLKNKSSIRKVPIHMALLERGILSVKDQCTNRFLFSPDDSDLASLFSKRFRTFLVANRLKREGLCFHSFRHSFIDGLRNCGVDRGIRMALAGHTSGNDVHDRYGSGYSLVLLQTAINKLEY